MGMFTAIFLLALAIILFVAVQKRWITNNAIQLGANIASIVAALAAIALFIIPAPVIPAKTLTDTPDKPMPTLELSTIIPTQSPSITTPLQQQLLSTPNTIVVTAALPSGTSSPPTLSAEIIISAAQGWQDSQVYVPGGTELGIEVIDGQWTHWKDYWSYYQGEGNPGDICSSACGVPIPDVPKGSLIGRVGNQIFGIGNKSVVMIQESGTLYLRMNDDVLGDNDGALTVSVFVLR